MDYIASPTELQKNGRHHGPDWSRVSALWQGRDTSGNNTTNMRPGPGMTPKQVVLHYFDRDEVYASAHIAAAALGVRREAFYKTRGQIRRLRTVRGECWVELRKGADPLQSSLEVL